MLLKLLSAPLTLPMAGLGFIVEQVADMADREMHDESSLRDQLLLLQVQLEDGDIAENEFAEREAEIVARLREIKIRQRMERADEPLEGAVSVKRTLVVETLFDE
jgi:cytochrome c-type biogenesis protein CcmH/NrfG